mgnify:CR=1 FL=1
MEDMGIDYFKKMYAANPSLDPECVTRLIQEKVTTAMC